MLRSAVSVSVVAGPEILVIGASTVISPRPVPAEPVLIVTAVPSFSAALMTELPIVDALDQKRGHHRCRADHDEHAAADGQMSLEALVGLRQRRGQHDHVVGAAAQGFGGVGVTMFDLRVAYAACRERLRRVSGEIAADFEGPHFGGVGGGGGPGLYTDPRPFSL
jgi:hypothetical protein